MKMRTIRWFAIAGAALMLLLAACNQPKDAIVHPNMVVITPTLELSKEFELHHSQSVRPVVTSKMADMTEVDVTSGSAELQYTMVVENVVVSESDSADLANLVIANTGSSSVTVDIADTLYCGDGTGAIDTAGPLAILVTSQTGITIAAGASHTITGPFGPFDVGACPDLGSAPAKDVVNRMTVTETGTAAVIAQADLQPTDATAISNITAGFLLDVEELPAGYSIAAAELTLAGSIIAIDATASGNLYTIATQNPAEEGTYLLTKTIVRDAGVGCAPDLQVLNTAYVSGDGTAAGTFGDAQQATIDLLCTPPQGGEGCTPGFWKEWTGVPPGGQPNAWAATGYHWGDPFVSAGFVNAFPGNTFLQVLNKGGGGKNALGRHAVAALLNAAHPDVSYDLSVAQVVARFNDVMINDGNVNALKSELETLNEQGCPLSQANF